MTRRREIIDTLKQSKMSAQDLANEYRTELRWIIDDLKHIRRTIEKEGLSLRSEPAYCRKCGFVFRDRDKVKAPTKCPKCRSEWIEKEMFFIE
ncbi:MAG: transcriptional regulator [Candidatus Woesearchaeota archaeon]